MTAPPGPFTVDPSAGRSLNDLPAATALDPSDRFYVLGGTDQDASVTLAVLRETLGAPPAALTPGSVVFAGPGGVLSQDNASLFFNDTLNALGVGITPLNTTRLRVGGSLGGVVSMFNVQSDAAIQSSLTNTAMLFRSLPSTQAAAFTLGNLRHFQAEQGAIGAGSIVTNQFGFYVHPSLIGASNNYAVRTEIPTGIGNNWNIYASGNAPNYMNGALGLGSTVLTAMRLRIAGNVTGGTTAYGAFADPVIQPDVTALANIFNSSPTTLAASFTIATLVHFQAVGVGMGAGSAITTQRGFSAGSGLNTAGTNQAFFGNVPAGAANWNIYMNGAANNYMAGALGVGTTDLSIMKMHVAGAMTGGTTRYNLYLDPTVQSDVTATAINVQSIFNTQAAAFTLGSAYHFVASGTPLGAGSAITSQYGYFVDASMTTAANNYAYYSALPAGTGRWNLYIQGLADSFIAGKLGIGAAPFANAKMTVAGNATGGGTFSYGYLTSQVVQSDIVAEYSSYLSVSTTQPAAFTLTNMIHYKAQQGTFGAGSIVTSQMGFFAHAGLIGATNNTGFYSEIPAGTGRWNFLATGTANNAFNGNVRIGSLTPPTVALDVAGAIASTTNINAGQAMACLTFMRPGIFTFATLPSAAGAGLGARCTINDANGAVFNAPAAGGGPGVLVVFSNGVVWNNG